jgi:septal ring factor EnvC (AmiA/AmiB activator)
LKGLRLILFYLIYCNSVSAQDSGKSIFESYKGKLDLPVSCKFEIEGNKWGDNKGVGCKYPCISFVSNSTENVKSLFDGIVVMSFQMGKEDDSLYVLMMQYENYYITYSGIQNIGFKKGDFVRRGQNLGAVMKGYDDKYRFDVYITNEKDYVNPMLWFKTLSPQKM